MTLDAAFYTQGDAFQSEKRTVFAQEWLPIAVKEQVAKPGQYIAAAIGGWPMLAVCGADGVTRAFRNTCRHRNMLLVERDGGSCENFRCRFHGWTYDLSGAFADAPPSVAPGGDSAEYALTPLALRAWEQVLLVNLQSNASTDELAGLKAKCSAQAQTCSHYAGARLMDIACNWKTLLECMLADDTVAWQWPTLLMQSRDHVMVIDQIVPRTFLRTRVIRHAYSSSPAYAGDAQPWLGALNELKARAEVVQSERAQGKPADTSATHVAALHAKLTSAYARDSAPA